MQHRSDLALFTLFVELVGDGERVGVDLKHRTRLLIDLLDAFEIHLGELARAQLFGLHLRLKLGDRHLDEFGKRFAVERAEGQFAICVAKQRHRRKTGGTGLYKLTSVHHSFVYNVIEAKFCAGGLTARTAADGR